ncbi:helix-turn-helix transcriptional regulator [Halobellus rarus]|uniref:Helix-turn-helix transcriptional regulator n=1 Tax=Halobellus rarus TaxID=1126237 RepID=A0ABD6CN57_9EURY|nr:helix-turn-helix transcriptional regulator [Halobellus rarus]
MSRWLQSGRRRDLCALLYEAGELRGQKLKTALERHYETRLDPKSFYGSLDALVDRGLVACETEGIHDVYRLTEAGVRGVESHHAWLTERLDGRDVDG